MQAMLAQRVFRRRNRIILYGPRNEAEVDIIFSLIAAAARRAAAHQAQQAARP
jgi:hypothetical protein